MGDIRDDDKKITEAGSKINGQVKLLKAYGQSIELSKLYPEDLQTIKNITSKGIPVVTIMISGRPLIVDQRDKVLLMFCLEISISKENCLIAGHNFHNQK
jgi:hypothetical protein